MSRIILITVFLTLVIDVSDAQITHVKADRDEAAEEEIKKLEFKLADLLMKRELDTYAGFLADDYLRLDAQGRVMTKAEVLSDMKAREPVKMTPENLRVRIYGETAILNGELTTKQDTGQRIEIRKSLFTKVFLKRDGRWFLVNNQGTLLKEKQMEK